MENFLFKKGYALLIGVGADLPVTVNDATALYDLLRDPSRAGYPDNQVLILTDKEATRENIVKAFGLLAEMVKLDPDATVIVYYSGHGGVITDANGEDEYFLLPFGYDRNNRSATALTGKEFTSGIENLIAKKIVVFLDCCHAAGMPTVKSDIEQFKSFPLPQELLTTLEKGTGKVIVASSHENEYSYTDKTKSVFTACLIDALNGKNTRGQDGFVRILEILIYLFDKVPQKAPGPQHPFVKKILDLGDNFSICRVPSLDLGSSEKSKPSVNKRKRVEQQLTNLQEEWDLRALKIKRIRKSLAIETNTIEAFRLEQILLQEEEEIAAVGSKLDQLESILSEFN